MYAIIYTQQARKDSKKLAHSYLKEKCEELLLLISVNPYQVPPFCEKLVGDLSTYFARRINKQHRLVYRVDESSKTIKILSMWTHYE
jgi:toxin YoeB